MTRYILQQLATNSLMLNRIEKYIKEAEWSVILVGLIICGSKQRGAYHSKKSHTPRKTKIFQKQLKILKILASVFLNELISKGAVRLKI